MFAILLHRGTIITLTGLLQLMGKFPSHHYTLWIYRLCVSAIYWYVGFYGTIAAHGTVTICGSNVMFHVCRMFVTLEPIGEY